MCTRACPRASCLLPCVKRQKRWRKVLTVIVLIIPGVQHAFWCYLINQTVKPDGDFQLEMGYYMCSNAYPATAYDLKCKQILFQLQLNSLVWMDENLFSCRSLHKSSWCLLTPLGDNEDLEEFSIPTIQFKATNWIHKTLKSQIIPIPKNYCHLKLNGWAGKFASLRNNEELPTTDENKVNKVSLIKNVFLEVSQVSRASQALKHWLQLIQILFKTVISWIIGAVNKLRYAKLESFIVTQRICQICLDIKAEQLSVAMRQIMKGV